ncbi:MAG: lactonase family protein [Ferruginibacter sp.]
MKLLLISLLSFFSFSLLAQQENYLLVGTYTGGKSEGIYVYKFNSSNADFSLVSTAKTSNPSFLAVSPDEKNVYAVNENADSSRFTTGGSIAAFSFDKKNGTLSAINKESSGGKHPCYVAVDKTGKWATTANYSSGDFSVLPIRKDGSLGVATQTIHDTGSGPVKGRQDVPHVHSTTFSTDNKYLFVADLGTDQLFSYHFNSRNGMVTPTDQSFFKTVPGSGPRHFAFHPNNKFAYLIEELSGNIVTFDYSDGKLSELQTISAHPVNYTGVIGSADIHVSSDGKFLYCSNRGESNTIGIFSIDQVTGKLTLIGHQSTLGSGPRNFNFDPSGNFLLVANQNSDSIIIFKIDKATGLLTDTGKKIDVPVPVCVKWIGGK